MPSLNKIRWKPKEKQFQIIAIVDSLNQTQDSPDEKG